MNLPLDNYGIVKRTGRSLPTCTKCSNTIRYGLTRKEWQDMVIAQDFKCPICKEKLKSGKSSCIDHKHTDNNKRGRQVSRDRVRAVLCIRCNTGLGAFKESSTILTQAIEYLSNHNHIKE